MLAIRRWPTTLLSLTLVVAAVGLLAPAAQAQLRGGSQRVTEPAVNTEDIDTMVGVLDMTEDQQTVLTEMHASYLERFNAEREKYVEITSTLGEDMRTGRNPDAMVAILEKTTDFRRYRDRSRDEFFDEVKTLLLNDEQTERFPDYERTWRRMHLSDFDTGAISGGAVDLIALTNEYDLGDNVRENLNPVLDRYAREFDEVVKARMALAEEFSTQQIELFEENPNPMSHMDAYGEMLDETRELVLEAREITQRYRRLIAAAMPDDQRQAFEQDVDRAFVPKVYASSPAAEAFDTAAGLESLTEDQRTQLEELRTRYEREAASINDRWAEALLEFEAERMTIMDAFGPGGPSDEEVRAAATERRDLDTTYIGRVRDILTEEQREAIPDPTIRSRWRDTEFGD